MKTYVITLSQVFPTWHKRAGEPTKFRAAFLSGQTCSKCKKRNHAMCTSECFSGLKNCYDVTLDNDKGINIDDIARNDGLNPIDFIEWFDRDICKQKLDDDGRIHKELAIIHFTKFRY